MKTVLKNLLLALFELPYPLAVVIAAMFIDATEIPGNELIAMIAGIAILWIIGYFVVRRINKRACGENGNGQDENVGTRAGNSVGKDILMSLDLPAVFAAAVGLRSLLLHRNIFAEVPKAFIIGFIVIWVTNYFRRRFRNKYLPPVKG